MSDKREDAITHDEPITYPKILYVCEYCQENYPEMCGHPREDIYVTRDGRWLCDGCLDEDGIPSRDCTSPPVLYGHPSPAAEPAQVPSGWRLFETAPMDGTVILVYRADAGVFTAHYVQEDAHLSNLMNPPEGDFYWFSTCGDDLTNDMPTHWMPLPAAPAPGGDADV